MCFHIEYTKLPLSVISAMALLGHFVSGTCLCICHIISAIRHSDSCPVWHTLLYEKGQQHEILFGTFGNTNLDCRSLSHYYF